MHIDIDWSKVVDIEYHIEEAGIWSITMLFDDNEAVTYGYTNLKDYMKDCTEIANRRNK